jgi:acyl-CoA oxidase
MVGDKNYGVQAFIVPVRDENMKLLPGIESGDIGPKIGYVARDNGYMIINKVGIPLKNMLARFITVKTNGKVLMHGNPKVAYAAMMEVRKILACAVPKIYASAIIIATKYSLFRKQFKNNRK